MSGDGPESVERLKERGDVDALLALLQDSDDFVVVAAAKTLAELNEQRAVDPLLRLVRGLNPLSMEVEWDMLTTALGQLATPGSPSADYLLTIVEGEDFWVPSNDAVIPIAIKAGRVLAAMGDRRVIDALLRRMEITAPADATDDTFWEWVEIADLLADLEAVEAVEPLAAALLLAPDRQQEYFANALHEIGDPRAIPALIAALEPHHGSYTFTSNDIVVALEDFGTPDALRAIESWERSRPYRGGMLWDRSDPSSRVVAVPLNVPTPSGKGDRSPRKLLATVARRVRYALRWPR